MIQWYLHTHKSGWMDVRHDLEPLMVDGKSIQAWGQPNTKLAEGVLVLVKQGLEVTE